MALGLAGYSATTFTSNAAAQSTVVSPTFSPAAGDLLYCVGFADNGAGSSAITENAPTNSGTALTWTLVARENSYTSATIQGTLFVWRAFNASSQASITVTVNSPLSTAFLKGVAVIGFTGADSVQAGAATAVTEYNIGATTPTDGAITTTQLGSWVWMAGWNWSAFRSGLAAASGQSMQIAPMDASAAGDTEFLQKENPQPAANRAIGTVVTMSDTGGTSGDTYHLVGWEIIPAAGAAAVTPTLQRYGQAAPLSPAPWAQRDRRDANTTGTAANPLPAPLDSAWQADARHSHLYGDSALRDRRQYFTQRPYASQPGLLAGPAQTDPTQSAWASLQVAYGMPAYWRTPPPQPRQWAAPDVDLTTAELENELLGGGDYGRQFLAAAYADRREVPQQRPYVSDPLLLTTAELENELLGGAGTPMRYGSAAYADRRQVPQQRACVSDPLLLTTAELENELLGGADTGRHYLAAAYWDRREAPQQRAYVSDPSFYPSGAATDPLTVAWGADGPYWHLYNRPASATGRREVPQQRAAGGTLPDPVITVGTGALGAWWSADDDQAHLAAQRRSPADQGTAGGQPLDPTLAGLVPRMAALTWPSDRREVPQQRQYPAPPDAVVTVGTGALVAWWGDDPAPGFIAAAQRRALADQGTAPGAPADPTILGWAVRQAALTWPADRRQAGQQRTAAAPPDAVITTGTGALAAWWSADDDQAHIAAQRRALADQGTSPGQPFDPVLAAWLPRQAAQTWPADRRQVPQQRTYYDTRLLATALLENELLGGADAARHWLAAAYADRREYPAQRLLVSDPNLLAPPVLLDPTQSAWLPLWLTCNNAAVNTDRREVPQQRPYLSDPSSYPALPAFDPTTSAAEDAARRARIAATHADRREVPAQRAYSVLPQGVPPSAVVFTYGTPYSGWEYGVPYSGWEYGTPYSGWAAGDPYLS